jgi:4-hydroxy-4-methyl-2-oxoglutarate aldolase
MMADRDLTRGMREFAAATVYEAAGKLGDMEPSVRPIVPGIHLVGPAFTVKCFVGDTTAVLRSIDLAKPGDVLVIDVGGTERASAWGGSSALAAKQRGLAGCVTNGSVRDFDELIEIRFPVFATGISVRGTVKSHPGWTGITVSVGGVAVKPGDIVIGDSDGVVVVAAERAEEICEKAAVQRKSEEERERKLRAGESLAKILGIS